MGRTVRYHQRHVPDGGWGWVVCASSFMIQVITNGTTLTFGILFVDLINYFHSSQSSTAWIGSIQAALMFITGFFSTPFLHRFGYRAVSITGAVLSAIGFGTSALATNVYILYFTYGICTGVGNGLMYITSIVTVQQYFNKHRGVANGITMSGSGVGVMVFGISTPFLVSSIGWQMMVVVNGGLTAVIGIMASALYKPLPYETYKKTYPNENKVQAPCLPPITEDETDLLFDTPFDLDQPQLDLTISFYEQNVFSYGSVTHDFEVVEAIPVRKSVPIFSVVPELIDEPDLFDYEFLEFPLAVESQIPAKTRRRYEAVSHLYQFFAIFREMFDLNLMKDPVFDLFTFAILMFTYGFSVPYAFLPEWALTLGAPYTIASLMIPIVGFTSIFSRLGFGWIADKFPDRRFDITGCLLMLNGILGLLSACFLVYESLIVYAAVLGCIVGGLVTMYPVILVDLIGREDFDQGLGLVLAITSIACLTAGPISGLIIDEFGKVSDVLVPFEMVGGAQILGGIAFFMIICIQKLRQRSGKNETQHGESEPLIKHGSRSSSDGEILETESYKNLSKPELIESLPEEGKHFQRVNENPALVPELSGIHEHVLIESEPGTNQVILVPELRDASKEPLIIPEINYDKERLPVKQLDGVSEVPELDVENQFNLPERDIEDKLLVLESKSENDLTVPELNICENKPQENDVKIKDGGEYTLEADEPPPESEQEIHDNLS